MSEQEYPCKLRSLTENNIIDIPDGKSFVLGRNKESKITDIRWSREQVKITPRLADCVVTVEAIGQNKTTLNEEPLTRGEKRVAHDGDVISVLYSDKKFKIRLPVISRKELKPFKTQQNITVQVLIDNTAYLEENERVDEEKARQSIGRWEHIGDEGLTIFSTNNIEGRSKIASFDLDGTIITTQTGRVRPANHLDWKILYPEVLQKLKNLYEDGYKIVVFTNQSGLGNKLSEFQEKIEAIVKKLSVPMQVFIASSTNRHRKPCTGMWTYLVEKKNNGVPVSISESFYCGDAAGRPADCYPTKKKKDFAASDRAFAVNVGLTFHTPEEYFLRWRVAPFVMPFRPADVMNAPLLEPATATIVGQKPEIILMVGMPGSGKSYFTRTHLVPAGYVRVNRDTLGTWQKCMKLVEDSLAAGRSVVVDNTNMKKEMRQRYLRVASARRIPIRAFVMNVTKEHALHNNSFRQVYEPPHLYKHLTNIAIQGMAKQYEPVTENEGFSEIIKVNYVPTFDTDERKEAYFKYYY